MTLANPFPLDFDEVRIFDDKYNDLEIMKKIINLENQEDAFQILNVADVIRKHRAWIQRIPRVVPHYAVKCNPYPTVIKTLASLGANFDCASKEEILCVMQFGVPSNRIIFANPVKTPSQLRFARKVGVDKMTVDSVWELRKIKELYPDAKIIIRFRCDALHSQAYLGLKFGCDPGQEAIRLIQATRDLNLELHGFSFHTGSPCGEVMAMSRGIGICKYLIDAARSMGCNDIQLIDIGGGIPGESDFVIDEFADVINESLKDIDPSIKVVSEPGRYYVTSAFTAAAYVHGKKVIMDGGRKKYMYYVNDGCYGSFIDELLNVSARIPNCLSRPETDDEEKYLSILWGPTCDSFDCVLKDVYLPEYNIGDWLYWKDMGAYGLSVACNFNGFPIPIVYPIIRRSAWDDFMNDIKNKNTSSSCVELTEIKEHEHPNDLCIDSTKL